MYISEPELIKNSINIPVNKYVWQNMLLNIQI